MRVGFGPSGPPNPPRRDPDAKGANDFEARLGGPAVVAADDGLRRLEFIRASCHQLYECRFSGSEHVDEYADHVDRQLVDR